MSCQHAPCSFISSSSNSELIIIFRKACKLQSSSPRVPHVKSYLNLPVQFKISYRTLECKGSTPLTRLPHERSGLWGGTARATRSVPVRTKAGALLGHVHRLGSNLWTLHHGLLRCDVILNPERSVSMFLQNEITRCHIPEDCSRHTCRRESHSSHTLRLILLYWCEVWFRAWKEGYSVKNNRSLKRVFGLKRDDGSELCWMSHIRNEKCLVQIRTPV